MYNLPYLQDGGRLPYLQDGVPVVTVDQNGDEDPAQVMAEFERERQQVQEADEANKAAAADHMGDDRVYTGDPTAPSAPPAAYSVVNSGLPPSYSGHPAVQDQGAPSAPPANQSGSSIADYQPGGKLYKQSESSLFAPPPSAFDRLYQMSTPGARDANGNVIGPPVMSKPKWWQTALAAGLGAGAGWSNAAGRTRTPIDIGAATEGILHPGYQGRLEEWQSRVAPVEKQAQIEAERATMQQKASLNQANISLKAGQTQAAIDHGAYWRHRAETESNRYTSATSGPNKGRIFDRVTGEWKVGLPTIQDLKEQGLAIGMSEPEAINYAASVASGGKYTSASAKPPTEAQTKDTQIKAEFAEAVGKDPAAVTDADMNQARRMFGSDNQLQGSMFRTFIAQNKRLPNAQESEGIINKAIRAKKQDITVNTAGTAGPTDIENNAQMIANYQTAPLNGFVLRTPEGRAIMARVGQINPDYHAQYYNNFNKTETDATTGRIGTSANALNVMMGHLSVLNDAAAALKSNDLQALNRIANYFNIQTGRSAVTTYQTIVHRLGPEITRAYVASGGSIGERNVNEQDFDARLGPDQIRNNIAISAQLADSKIRALQDQYQRGTYGRGQQKLISEEAEAARQRLAGMRSQKHAGGRGGSSKPPAMVNMKAPNGQVSSVPSDQVDHYKSIGAVVVP